MSYRAEWLGSTLGFLKNSFLAYVTIDDLLSSNFVPENLLLTH